MSSSNYAIEDITKIISVARENAVLGAYSHALSKYKTGIEIIKKRIKEIETDPAMKERWNTVALSLKTEVETIVAIVESCDTFKVANEESSEKKQYNLNQLNENVQGQGQEKGQEQGQGQGQKPNEYFNPNQNLNKERNKDNNQDILDNINFVKNISKQVENNINKIQSSNNNNNNPNKPQSNINPLDDFNNNNNRYQDESKNIIQPNRGNNNNNYPQPSQPKKQEPSQDDFRKNLPKNKIDSNANANAPSNRINQGGPGPRYNANVPRQNVMGKIHDALNSYQPGKKQLDKYGNLAGKDGKDKGSSQSTKSAFLLHHYPNGDGPDTELIEMLEREVVDTNPCVRFEDIAELDGAKKTLQEAVLLPLIIPDYFKGIRRPWRGVLLYGPPGTGKTMLAKALATQGKTTFFNVHSSSFASKWRGESEKLVRILFEMARFYAPTTIFIDEVDSLCSKRGEGGEGEGSRRVKAEILVQMEGVTSNTSANANEESEEDKRKIVTTMAATNRPWDLDDALRRRFEKRVYIPLPNVKGRAQLFQLNLSKVLVANDIDYNKLINATDGYSGADISNVCREAALMPMRRSLAANKTRNIEELVADSQFRKECEAPIGMKDLLEAIGNISKSVSQKDLEVYDKWTSEFASV